MESREERRERLRKASKEAAAQADALLDGEIRGLMGAATDALEALRPKVTDPETYAALIAVVQAATRNNESIAQLRSRLESAGKKVVAMAKEAVRLLG